MVLRRFTTLRPHKSTLNPSRHLSQHQQSKHLEGLNSVQYKVVNHPSKKSLQVLAGPGSGKTRVLTSRIAKLVQDDKLKPASICAVTFTRKAAQEMRDRLEDQIGVTEVDQMHLGTFHSVCLRFLREYRYLIDIKSEIKIWDEDDCQQIVDHLTALHNPEVKKAGASVIRERIASAKGSAAENAKEAFLGKGGPDWLGQLFDDYQEVLKISGAVDFEDLLRLCENLFRKAPWIPRLKGLQHVLVDEFQDTSERQYNLLRHMFAPSSGSITIVGDPDQAIYAWRNADIANFKRMKQDLPSTEEFLLEENYRSTESILKISHAIISQDSERPEKHLYTKRAPPGPKPALLGFRDTEEQADFIATEIRRLVDSSKGIFGYGDIAVLFRENQFFDLTASLIESNIPYRILRDTMWFESMPCKVLLAYLRVALDPTNTPSICLALKYGPSEVKPDYISRLVQRSIMDKRPLYYTMSESDNTNGQGITAERMKIIGFILVIEKLKNLLDQGESTHEILNYVYYATKYDDFLNQRLQTKAFRDKQDVQRLISLARTFGPHSRDGRQAQNFLDRLHRQSKSNNMDVGKVTLSTAHSAKGLEWPVVFIPEVVDGSYPHRRTEDEVRKNEER